ncbi:MAG: hypothetical protein IIA33_08660, partial [Planctomycetes bacterium]|nr:hypothetical protein [Planctomycetota bacterium]
MLAYDNISKLSNNLSDAMCRLATGGGHSTRRLYTDSAEVFFNGQRPLVMNSIIDFTHRGDLRDRCILIELPPLLSTSRKDEKTFWDEFEKYRPRILGALLAAVSEGLRNVDSTRLDKLPRMADFAKWVTACEPGLAWRQGTIYEAYQVNIGNTIDDALELDPLAQTIIALVEEKGPWQGTATDLSRDLQTVTGRKVPNLE